MSKLNFRMIFSVLISLGVILAVYTSVQSASLNALAGQVGSHSVGGLMTNFNHDRFTVAEQDAAQAHPGIFSSSEKRSGHGCESEAYFSPID